MTRLSIIVPFLNHVEAFENTLASVLQNRPSQCEVLVVQAWPYDDPYDLRDEVRFVEACGARSCAELLEAGLGAARSDVIHWIACGIEVREGWTEAAVRHFADSDVATVVPLIVHAKDPACILSAGLGYSAGGSRSVCGRNRRLCSGSWDVSMIGPSLDAAFFRKSVVVAEVPMQRSLGDAWVDVDLALTLRAKGYRAVFEPNSRLLGMPGDGPARASVESGRAAELVFWRHAAVQGWMKSLLMHPLTVAADLTKRGGFRSLAGRLAACRQIIARETRGSDYFAGPELASMQSPVRTTTVAGQTRRVA